MSFTDAAEKAVESQRRYGAWLAASLTSNSAVLAGFTKSVEDAVVSKVLRQLASGRLFAEVGKIKVSYYDLRFNISETTKGNGSLGKLSPDGGGRLTIRTTDASNRVTSYTVTLEPHRPSSIMEIPYEMHKALVLHLRSVDEHVDTVTFRDGYMHVTFSPVIKYYRG